MRHLDLFSGIGGFTVAAEWAFGDEHEQAGFCEIDPFCQAVIRKHWPGATIHSDIRDLHGEPGTVDLITGGFPCQPFSTAGRRLGRADDRHLWPEMRRVISEFKPTWVVGENVAGLLNMAEFEGVCADLEAEGYEVQPVVIPACAVNAPHRRDRIWIIAHAKVADDRRDSGEVQGADEQQASERPQERTTEPGGADCSSRTLSHTEHDGLTPAEDREGGAQRADGDATRAEQVFEPERPTVARTDAPDSTSTECEQPRTVSSGKKDRPTDGSTQLWDEHWMEAAARLCHVDDGLPGGLARPRGWRNAAIKAGGNAIVPQVAYEVLKAMKAVKWG